MAGAGRRSIARAVAVAAISIGGLAPTAAASAQVYGGGSSVPPTVVSQAVGEPSAPTVAAPGGARGALPFTGGDVAGLAVIGVGALAGGLALARPGRRPGVTR